MRIIQLNEHTGSKAGKRSKDFRQRFIRFTRLKAWIGTGVLETQRLLF